MTEPTYPPASPASAAQLGGAIRARRKALRLSLVTVAGRTDLSHSFLSQLERGKTRGSMRSLFAIAQALETTQEELIAAARDGAASPAASTVSAAPDVDADGGPRARLLMHAGDHLDVTEMTDLPREMSDFFEHDRPEFLYVLRGEIEFEMMHAEGGSSTSLRLKAGETVSCPGRMSHRYRSVGEQGAAVLMIHYPN